MAKQSTPKILAKPALKDEDKSGLTKLLASRGLYDKKDVRIFDKFSRFGYFDMSNTLGGTPREYIFFTRPDLHLFNGDSLNPQLDDRFFSGCYKTNKEVMKSLQSTSGGASPFINILTNRVTSKLDLPSISAGEMETASNIFGDNITYRLGSGSAYNAHDFSLEFEDTKYLDVYMLFKIWDVYCDKKAKGNVTPTKDSYTVNKILHDQVSVFKFIVDDDMETIVHYSKLTGVYPKEVPLSTFSSLDENIIKHTVEFHAQFVEDMDPVILKEFNHLTSGKGKETVPVYDNKIKEVSGEWVSFPYIEIGNTKGSRIRHKLKWRR